MYTGTLAPSHQRKPLIARRLSGGDVTITYAAATPAETRTTFATVRAAELVMNVQLRREPGVRVVELGPSSLEPPRMVSEFPP
jgi:hypothetical protein